MTAGIVTVQTVLDKIRSEADMVGSTFITDAEFLTWIAASHFELYDILVQKFGDNYFVSSANITTTTAEEYSLATDFYKLLGVDLKLSSTEDSYITLFPFQFAERNKYAVPNFQTFYGITNLRYRLNGSKLWFTPKPMAGQTIRYFYIPRLTAITATTDNIDGVSGWEEYIVVDCCIKALQKEESDTSVFLARKAALLRRIEEAAENRDAGSPATVSDVQHKNNWWPNAGGLGGFY